MASLRLKVPDRCSLTLHSGFTSSGVLTKPFELVRLPSVATEERDPLIKASLPLLSPQFLPELGGSQWQDAQTGDVL